MIRTFGSCVQLYKLGFNSFPVTMFSFNLNRDYTLKDFMMHSPYPNARQITLHRCGHICVLNFENCCKCTCGDVRMLCAVCRI